MGGPVEFSRNYNDVSTEHGFQFEFICDRCGNGSRTQFKPFTMGAVNNVLDTASSLLGGIFGQASTVSSRVTEAQRERAREEALLEAIEQIRPTFVQCPHCSAWVCRKSCWNNKRGLCKSCAPDLGVEMAAAQSSKSIEEAWEKATIDEEAQRQIDGDWKETKSASCPECDAPLPNTNAKFCPECGAKLNAVKHCTECGAKIQPGSKFCGECGHKVDG